MFFKKISIPLFLTLFSSLTMATEYNDWKVYDNKPAGATIENGEENNVKYIELKGDHRRNSYLSGARKSSTGWNNQTEKQLKWSMNYSERFKISIYTQTTKGLRVLQFDYKNRDKGLYRKKYIRMGLGKESISGQWKKFSRNLEDDLQKYEPDNKIVSINGFKIQGSGKIANVQLVKIAGEEPDNPIIKKVKDSCQNNKKDTNIICSKSDNLAYIVENHDGDYLDNSLHVVDTSTWKIISTTRMLNHKIFELKKITSATNTNLIYASTSTGHTQYLDFYATNREKKSLDNVLSIQLDDNWVQDTIEITNNGTRLHTKIHHNGSGEVVDKIYNITKLPDMPLVEDNSCNPDIENCNNINPIVEKVKEACQNKKENINIICSKSDNLAYIAEEDEKFPVYHLHVIDSLNWKVLDTTEMKNFGYVRLKKIKSATNANLIYAITSKGHTSYFDFYATNRENKSLEHVLSLSSDDFSIIDSVEITNNGSRLDIKSHLYGSGAKHNAIYDITNLPNIPLVKDNN